MRTLLVPFIVLAAVGLLASLMVHFCAVLGIPNPLGPAAWGLHVGIFAVWIPAVIVSQRMTKGSNRADFWKDALRGCPPWMKVITLVFFVYALGNFAWFFLKTVGLRASETPESAVFRGFSGHWMAFYSAAVAILYSFLSVATLDLAARCPNGHPVPPGADSCPQCGLPLLKPIEP
ncbi:MAG: zinc ribbon domain-containing protein [Thermodesulfobacteriota bacterium]